MRKGQRWKKPVPLYDSKGTFLEYITLGAGSAAERTGAVLAIREFKYGRECVTGYREIASSIRNSLSSVISK